MELRDEFIKAALTGFTAAIGPRAFDLDVVAKQCCDMADAVLRARTVPHKTQEQILKEWSAISTASGQPALTDAEREAVEAMAGYAEGAPQRFNRGIAATLRGLRERLGGGR